MKAEKQIPTVNSAFIPHDHAEYVEGCFRCDLSRFECSTPQAADSPRGGGGSA